MRSESTNQGIAWAPLQVCFKVFFPFNNKVYYLQCYLIIFNSTIENKKINGTVEAHKMC